MKRNISVVTMFFAIQIFAQMSAQTGQKPELVVQLGHLGAISSAVFSPDGRFVVSGGIDDKTAILWEAATGREIRRFVGHQSAINSVAFSSDSRFILTASGEDESDSSSAKDYTARLWEISNGNEVRTFHGHTGKVNSATFSPVGQFVLTASDDHSARLWDIATGRLVKKFDHASSVSFADVAPKEHIIVTACASAATVWNLDSGRVIKRIGPDVSDIKSVRFSSDGRFVITAGYENINAFPYDSDLEKTVRKWDIRSGQAVGTFKGTRPGILSPSGHSVITGGAGENMAGATIWDTKTQQQIHRIGGHKSTMVGGIEDGNVVDAAFSPDEKSFLLVFGTNAIANAFEGAGENSIYVYDASSKQKRFALGRLSRLVSNISFPVPETFLLGNSVWMSETGAQQAFEEVDKSSSGKQTEGGLVQELSRDGLLALGFTVSSKSNSIDDRRGGSLDSLMASDGRIVTVWNAATGKVLHKFGRGYSAHFSPDGRLLLTESFKETDGAVNTLGSGGITLTLWNVRTGERVWGYDFGVFLGGVLIRSLTFGFESMGHFSPNSQFVLFPNPDRKVITALDSATGKEVFELKNSEATTIHEHLFIVEETTAAGTGKANATTDKHDLLLYEIRSRKLVSTLKLNRSEEFRVTSPDDDLLATSQPGKDKNQLVKVWSSSSGKVVNQFYIPTNGSSLFPNRMSFSRNNQLLIVYVDNEMHFYDVRTGTQVRKISVPKSTSILEGAFSPDYRFILIGSLDGTRIYNSRTSEEVCRLISFDDGTWVVTTREGRFDTNNLESIVGLHWILQDDPLSPKPLEIFSRQYYEPRLLPRLLKCHEEGNCEQQMKALPSIADINRVQPKVGVKEIIPTAKGPDLVDVTVEVANVTEGPGSSSTDGIKKKRLSSGAFDLHLFRDGQLVGVSTPREKLAAFINDAPRLVAETRASGRLIDTPEDRAWREANDIFKIESENVKSISPDKVRYTFRNVKLPRDGRKEIEFTAYAFNADRVKSTTTEPSKFTIPAAIANAPKKGRAIILSIGVNISENPDYDLRYAANDARKMQEILGTRLKADIDKYSEVIQIPLISDHGADKSFPENIAQKATIKGVFSLLAGNEKEIPADVLKQIPNANTIKAVEPEDTLIITYAGHGYADQSGIFYLLPYDIGKSTRQLTSEALRKTISSDELSLWMQDITAAEMIMIIDACHSSAAVQGDGFKPGPMGSRGLGQLAYDKDMKILSATQAENVALELNSLQQGLLSYALLQDGIISSLADTDKNKELFAAEWLSYAEKRVPELYQEAKDGKRGLIIDGINTKAGGSRAKILNLLDGKQKSGLNLQQPSLFDFKRRNTRSTLLTLP